MTNNKKKIVAIVPARMASNRFPGKPLAKISGLSMVEHVRRRLAMCDKLDEIIVATCDKAIRDSVERFGGHAVMTSDKHERCTDRVAEAAKDIDADIIVNVQGDEPLVRPEMISQLVEPMVSDDKCECANLVSPIVSEEEFESPNTVKAVFDLNGNILYFSREPIPSRKKAKGDFKKYRQLGIIAFTKNMLMKYASLKQTPIEKAESIDMMRLLEHGYPIRAIVVDGPLYGVDTPDELKKVESMMKTDNLMPKYIR